MHFMIIFAVSFVLLPIAVILYFVFYKIWLHFLKDRFSKQNETLDDFIPENKEEKPILDHEDTEYDYCILDDADEEITAVIAAAVKMYLNMYNFGEASPTITIKKQ